MPPPPHWSGTLLPQRADRARKGQPGRERRFDPCRRQQERGRPLGRPKVTTATKGGKVGASMPIASSAQSEV
jgi:hypothetical protein